MQQQAPVLQAERWAGGEKDVGSVPQGVSDRHRFFRFGD